MPSAITFQSPMVVAVLPTCAVLSWAPPCFEQAKPFTDHLTWNYQIEYNCSCKTRSQQPYSTTVSDTFVLLATPHEEEVYYVRVVAKAFCAGSTVGLTSAKVVFKASCTLSTPWLSERAIPVCIFDALYVCTGISTANFEALSTARSSSVEWPAVMGSSSALYTLEGDVVVRAVRVEYKQAAALPLCAARTVYYMTAAAAEQPRRHTNEKELAEKLQREGAAFVFCGIGGSGHLAVRAAHALLSFLTAAHPSLCPSVLCITYGTPRVLLREGPLLRMRTFAHSGQFIHITQRTLKPFTSPLKANRVSSQTVAGDSHDARTPPPGYAGGFYYNTLLGLRGNAARGASARGGELLCRLSCPSERITEAEEVETFDVPFELRTLSQILFSRSPQWMAPTVTSVHCSVAGPLLYVTVKGSNLHYCPRITLAPCEEAGAPCFPRIVACTPLQLDGLACSLPWVESQVASSSFDGRRSSYSIPLSILVHTAFGAAITMRAALVALPADLVHLFDAARHARLPWSVAAAPGLVEDALRLQPLLALSSSGGASYFGGEAMSNSLLEILCSLASAAEVAVVYGRTEVGANNTGGGVGRLLSSVAQLITAAPSPAVTDSVTQNLKARGVEAAFLGSAIAEWKGVGFSGMSVWSSRTDSWKQRLFYAFPLLGESSYRTTLERILRVFETPEELHPEVPLVWLEARIYAYAIQHVAAAGQPPISASEPLCRALSLDGFIKALYNAFRCEPESGAPSRHGRECVTLWALCHCFELRREMARLMFCCTVGCAGSGVSTLSACLTSVLYRDEDLRPELIRRNTHVVDCRLAVSRLPALYLAAPTGVRMCVFLAAEVADVAKAPYISMHALLQANLAYHTQRVFRVITKGDESLVRVVGLRNFLRSEPTVKEILSRLEEELFGGSSEARCPLIVSLAPSVSLLSEAAECTTQKADTYASLLRAYSQEALRKCVRLAALDEDDDGNTALTSGAP